MMMIIKAPMYGEVGRDFLYTIILHGSTLFSKENTFLW